MLTCTNCETENIDGTLYCDNCGAELPENAFVTTESDELFEIPLGDSSGAFLVHQQTGEKFSLEAKEELVIGREDPVSGIFPDIDTTVLGGEENGVSRQHAKITCSENQYFVEDLDSVNATFVNKEKVAPHNPVSLNDGDELMLGRLKLVIQLN